MAPSRIDVESGLAAQRAGQLTEARRCYERALARDPRDARALLLLGQLELAERRPAQAVARFEALVRLQPGLGTAHNALGCAWLAGREPARAEESFRRALACPDPSAEACCNLGALCRGRGEMEEAAALYRRAITLKPGLAEAWCNLGVALRELRQLPEAAAALRQAQTLKPEMAEAWFNEGLLRLLQGDYPAGWKLHEHRWTTEQRGAGRDFPVPLWLGEAPVAGRTVLLHAEQGLGDTLQFARYAPLLAARGARVILEVPRPLVSLLAGIAGVERIVARGEALPAFDLHCPLLSLPLAFGTTVGTIPATVPYLTVPEIHLREWAARVPAAGERRVGLVWYGNREHRNDRLRSMPAEAMGPLLAVQGVQWHCLQKGAGTAADAAVAASARMVNRTAEIADFADTAAYLTQLDLVITVDTSVAHLAGALGRPVWVLLPFVPDWRWLLDREDSPWYPSARLWRQPALRDWDSVVRRVAAELAGGPDR